MLNGNTLGHHNSNQANSSFVLKNEEEIYYK